MVVLLLLAALAVWYFELDSDLGGYRDSFRSPDKFEHAALSALLCSLLLNVQMGAVAAVGYAVYAGILFEIAQKVPTPRNRTRRKWMSLAQMCRYSWRDVVADFVGAASVVLVVELYLKVVTLF